MAKAKSKKKFVIFSVIAVAVIAVAVAASLKKSDPPVSVEMDKVARRTLIEKVVANGKIEPVLQVKISPEVSGEIIELAVKEGQHVQKGDLLVKIKPDNYLAASNSASASYNLAAANKSISEANLEKARLEHERSSGLFKAKLISDSDYLTAKTTYDVAKTTLDGSLESVAMAKAALQTAAADLSKTTIYSPLDGTVSKLNSQLGERVVGTAMMAGTEMMTIADLNTMEARVDVGEVDVVLIAVCQKAHLEVDAFKDRKFEGSVTDVANSANNNDTSSATTSTASTTTDATKFQVKIRVTDKEAFLPGMSVTAEIETRSRSNVLTVPIQSVTTRLPATGQTNGSTHAPTNAAPAMASSTNNVNSTNTVTMTNLTGGSGTNNSTNTASGKINEPPKPVEVVFVVEGDHVKSVPVKRGISDDNYTEIIEGLHEGDTVVTGGYKAINRDLEDGKKVVKAVAAAAGKPKAAEN
jgi:HlyD family secretion protein